MNMNWTTSHDGHNNNEPMTTKQKVWMFVLGFILFLVCVAALAKAAGRYDEDPSREVWWTQPCPTKEDPHRVCLDGSVSLDRIPQWAGGAAK